MIIEIPDENSIVKWRYNSTEEWQSAEISDLINAYERPKGEWRLHFDKYFCSNCGTIRKDRTMYCPNCGAYMKGGVG